MDNLFEKYPGLQNYYENAVQAGYTGTPQDIYAKFMEEMSGKPVPSSVLEYNNALAGGYTGTMNDFMAAQRANAGAQTLLEAISPEKAAYQRSLLSGTTQPNNMMGFGMAGSPFVGYSPNNPYSGLLY